MSDLGSFFFLNTTDSLIISTFLTGYLGSKFKTKGRYLSLAIFVFLYVLSFYVLMYLTNDQAHVIASIFCIPFSYLFCLFFLRGNPLQKLFLVFILISIYLVVNVTLSLGCGLILEWFKIPQDIRFNFVINIFDKIILFYVFRFVLNYRQRDESFIKPRDWIIIVMSPIFTFTITSLLMPLLLTVESMEDTIIMYIVVILLFASNIITYYLYVNTIKNSRSALQLEKLKQQHEYEKRHYNEMTKKHEEIRVIRHNIKNQLIYLESAMKDGKSDEAVKFINKLTQNVEYTGDYVRTNNYAVNCILNAMITKAAESKIYVTAQIAEDIDITLDPLDVTVILGNLMENAMEASQKLNEAERKIGISIEHDMTGLLIRITNKVENSVLKNNPKFITDKQDKLFHGLGIQSVKKLVHKYDGLMMCQEEDNNFTWTIVFDENTG